MYESHIEQLERIDRLMRILTADDPTSLMGNILSYDDLVVFSVQNMWHMKDWIINDPELGTVNIKDLEADIYEEKCLQICADLANKSKHLSLRRSKTDFEFSESKGIHLDTGKGIFQRFYYVKSKDKNDRYHGWEIRDLLSECRAAWDRIIFQQHKRVHEKLMSEFRDQFDQ